MSNPYSASTADLSQVPNDSLTYSPKLLSINGRIGRVRYLAFSVMMSLSALAIGALLAGALFLINPMLAAGAALVYVPMLAYSFILVIRRLNDLNHSGWWSIGIIVPLLNLPLAIYLLFAPGTAGSNNYGLAPGPNTRGVLIAAWAMPVMAVIFGIIGALAMPYYQAQVAKEAASDIPVEAAQ